jgi:hypothetical protein
VAWYPPPPPPWMGLVLARRAGRHGRSRRRATLFLTLVLPRPAREVRAILLRLQYPPDAPPGRPPPPPPPSASFGLPPAGQPWTPAKLPALPLHQCGQMSDLASSCPSSSAMDDTPPPSPRRGTRPELRRRPLRVSNPTTAHRVRRRDGRGRAANGSAGKGASGGGQAPGSRTPARRAAVGPKHGRDHRSTRQSSGAAHGSTAIDAGRRRDQRIPAATATAWGSRRRTAPCPPMPAMPALPPRLHAALRRQLPARRVSAPDLDPAGLQESSRRDARARPSARPSSASQTLGGPSQTLGGPSQTLGGSSGEEHLSG